MTVDAQLGDCAQGFRSCGNLAAKGIVNHAFGEQAIG